jgi:hypothetical protein
VADRSSASAWVPDLVAAAGPRATDAYIEFFTATIRNRNTRLAYARACYQFFHWCQENGLTWRAKSIPDSHITFMPKSGCVRRHARPDLGLTAHVEFSLDRWGGGSTLDWSGAEQG